MCNLNLTINFIYLYLLIIHLFIDIVSYLRQNEMKNYILFVSKIVARKSFSVNIT